MHCARHVPAVLQERMTEANTSASHGSGAGTPPAGVAEAATDSAALAATSPARRAQCLQLAGSGAGAGTRVDPGDCRVAARAARMAADGAATSLSSSLSAICRGASAAPAAPASAEPPPTPPPPADAFAAAFLSPPSSLSSSDDSKSPGARCLWKMQQRLLERRPANSLSTVSAVQCTAVRSGEGAVTAAVPAPVPASVSRAGRTDGGAATTVAVALPPAPTNMI